MSSKETKIGIFLIILLSLAIFFVASKTPKKNQNTPSQSQARNGHNFSLSLPDYYIGQDGQQYPIITDVVPSSDSQYGYQNTTNNFKTYFPKNLDPSKNIKYQVADSWVNFNIISLLTIQKPNGQKQDILINSQVSSTSDSNKLIYPKIYQNGDKFIDINYTISKYKLSEEMILNKYQDFPELTQHLSLHNANIKVDGQKINFISPSTGKVLWLIDAPKMYEQNNPAQTSGDLVYDVKCDDQKISLDQCTEFTLTKKFTDAGKKWLADPARQYPVVIDPSYYLDSADIAANWTSSDTTNFTVSQETTIKHEGTGSIKIVGAATNSCWSRDSSTCSNSCNSTSYSSSGGLYSCINSYSCGGGWGSGCNYSSYNYFPSGGTNCNTWTMCGISTWKWNTTGPTAYSAYGTCSSDGSGTCYSGSTTSIAYTGTGVCTTGSANCPILMGNYFIGTPTPCTWSSGSYYYVRSGSAVTRYQPNYVACAPPNGSNSCYASGGGSTTYYNSDGSGCGNFCGSAGDWENPPTQCNALTTSSLNDTVTKNLSGNFSTIDSITFWVYASRTGSYMRFQMGESVSTEQTFPFSINSVNTWEQKTWDISAIPPSSRDGILRAAFQNTDASSGYTFYFDEILINEPVVIPTAPSTCIIRESATDTPLIPQWADNSSNEDGFQLDRSINSAAFSLYQTLGTGVTGFVDNLSVGSTGTYSYRVRAYKGADFSDYCTHPTLNLQKGSFKFNGLKMNGLKIN